MALTNAERQKRWRERRKQEREQLEAHVHANTMWDDPRVERLVEVAQEYLRRVAHLEARCASLEASNARLNKANANLLREMNALRQLDAKYSS